MKFGFAMILVLAVSLAWNGGIVDAKPAAVDTYCATIGKGISPDPDLRGNWPRIVKLHARGCWEWYGTWRPPYVKGKDYRCNVIAYDYAKTGMSTKRVTKLTLAKGCFQYPDGTYGAKS